MGENKRAGPNKRAGGKNSPPKISVQDPNKRVGGGEIDGEQHDQLDPVAPLDQIIYIFPSTPPKWTSLLDNP